MVTKPGSPDAQVLAAIGARLAGHGSRALATAVATCVRDGTLSAGTVLPPIRRVARWLRISPNTVAAAWSELSRAGLLRSDGRRGTTVRDAVGRPVTRYRTAMSWRNGLDLDLSAGVPDPALLPALCGTLFGQGAASVGQSYLDDAALPELLATIAASWPFPPPNLMVCDGVMDGLELVVRTHLGLGSVVGVEDPAFTPMVDLLESVGADIVGLPLDADGLKPADLVAVGPRLDALYLQPRGQNPTGVSMSAQRARQLADVLEPTKTLVIEDDSSAEVSQAPPVSLGQFAGPRTVHIRGYSKSHGPDLRIAALSAPDDVLAPMRAYRQLGQGWTSRLLQHILLHLLTAPGPVQQVQRAKQIYARRRQCLAESLAAHGVEVGCGDGINMWVPVADESAAMVLLASRGIGVAPGRAFQLRPDGAGDYVRITCGLVPESEAPALAELLAQAAGAGGWR